MKLDDQNALTLRVNFDLAAKMNLPVTCLRQASKNLRAIIEANNFGASDMRKDCGNVCLTDGSVRYTVSYNGRVWDKATGEEIVV